VQRELFVKARSQLETAGLLPNGPYHKGGAAVIREILKKGAISGMAYSKLMGYEARKKLLLETDVFFCYPYEREVTFQSPMMKRCCELNPAYWKE
jgi:hypothetical protein